MQRRSAIHPARQLYIDPIVRPERLTVDPAKLRDDMVVLSAVHDAVKSGLEEAREAKVVGSSLQCSIAVSSDREDVARILNEYNDELPAMFVVSDVAVNMKVRDGEWCYTRSVRVDGSEVGSVVVLPPRQAKCSRCWRYVAEQEDTICSRCDTSVAEAAQAA